MSDYHTTTVGSSYRKDYLASTNASVDGCIWYDAYFKGYKEPNYPVPAIPLAVVYPQAWDAGIDYFNTQCVFVCRVTERFNDGWEGVPVLEIPIT